MPKKDKSRKKKTGGEQSREIVDKGEDQEYAIVEKMLGNGRLEAKCQDGKKRLCIIRGNMRNRQWISVGNLVLISTRDYQDGKADVIHKYNDDECRQLKKSGKMTMEIQEKTEDSQPDQPSMIDFESI